MAKILLVVFTLLLSSCATHPVDIKKYADQRPLFTVKKFFQGHVQGYGALTDNNMRLVNRFSTGIDVRWQGNDGLMKQVFQFSDGQSKTRLWCLHVVDEHRFSLISSLYEGKVAGTQYGNVMHLVYQVKLPNNKNYYADLHKTGDFWDAINNSPEHALYTLFTSTNVIADVKTVHSLSKQYSAYLKIPEKIDIGDYCAQKDNEWRSQREQVQSYTTFELDNWMFMLNDNLVMQETAVNEHHKKLGQLNIVLLKGYRSINPDQT